MNRYEVTVRTYLGDTSRLRTLEVISDSPLQANVSALKALKIKDTRFNVTVKPMKMREGV